MNLGKQNAMPNPSQLIKEELGKLRDNYKAELPTKISQISSIWENIKSSAWENTKLLELHKCTHNLAGSGRTFGFAEISTVALKLDNAIKPLIETNNAPNIDSIAAIERIIKQLDQAFSEIDHTEIQQSVDQLVEQPLGTNARPDRANNIIWYLAVDHQNHNQIIQLLNEFGFQVDFHPIMDSSLLSTTNVRDNSQQPDIVVLDLGDSTFDENESVKNFVQQLGDNTKLIVFSTKGDIYPRLQAVRAGSKAYFTHPVDSSALIDCIDKLTHTSKQEPYRILIIDDSLSVANAYSAYLQLVGMQTLVVTDPFDTFNHLHQFNPELILLDMYMPGCSGQELATVIRQQELFTSVPIVFLSAESDRNKQLNAMSLGGDDFLTKPIEPQHLVSAVASRAERYRGLRSHMIKDSLTGLLNHTKTEEHLEIEIARASRYKDPLAYIMIDIDKFKNVNDTYGHATGDRIIKSLARLLQQSLRKTDIIGRYGGEEFAVILTATDAQTAFKVMEKIRLTFANIIQNSNQKNFNVTFSCGIAGFPKFNTSSSLNDAADRALYQAKVNGRNQIIIAS